MFKQTCQSHVLTINETTTVLLESLADSHSHGIEIDFLSEQSDSQKVFQLDWSDWELELSFIVIKLTELQQNKELTWSSVMVIEVCQPKSAQVSTLGNSRLVFQVQPKFRFDPTCPGASCFLSRPTCLPPCWLDAQLLYQVHNCSQINYGPGYRWTAAGPRHGLARQTRSHPVQRSSGWGDSQSQAGLH